MIYLASPYSHSSMAVKVRRFNAACQAAALLIRQGEHVFSPIAHTHPIAILDGLPGDFDYWEEFDRKMIAACDELRVLMLDGWAESRGVTAEIEIAVELGLKVTYMDSLKTIGMR